MVWGLRAVQLLQHVFMVGSGDTGIYLTDRLDCNCYLVDCTEGFVLIDAGIGIQPELIEREIARVNPYGKPLLAILITHGHADHVGGCAYFREKYGADVYAPKKEAEIIATADEERSGLRIARNAGYYPADYHMIPCKVDHEVAAGDSVFLGSLEWKIFQAAGHSIGGVCYMADIDGKCILFSGDLIGFGGKISLQNIPGSNVHAYADSIHALTGLDIDGLFPGHGLFALQCGQSHIDRVDDAFNKLFVPA